jgi:hypothetical protein
MPKRKITQKDQKLRSEWRDKVYDKCNGQCICCFTKKDIQAHHLYSYRDYPEFRYDVNNGVVLCAKCHHAYHELGHGIGIEEFIRWFRKQR